MDGSRRAVLSALVGLGLVASLTLTGCSAAVPGGSPSGGGTAGSDTVDGSSTEFVPLPDTFPVAEIPIIDGGIAFAIDLGTGWSVVIPVDDFSGSFEAAAQKLIAAGYESSTESIIYADSSFGVFSNVKYDINLTAANTPDFGPAVQYLVVISG